MAIILLLADILLRRFPEFIDRAVVLAAKLKPVIKPKKKTFEERVKENNETEKEKPVQTAKAGKDDVNNVNNEKKSSASALADIKRNRKK